MNLRIVKDYYAILGVSHDASTGHIMGAYRRMAKAAHPDNSEAAGDGGPFQLIQEAYTVLCKEREGYDSYQDKVRAQIQHKRQGDNIELNLVLDPFECVRGGGQLVELDREERCQECHGKTCPQCNGLGLIVTTTRECLKFPPDVRAGDLFRYVGLGHHGLKGGSDGDILATVVIMQAPQLKTSGNDIWQTLPIGLDLASKGGLYDIELPDGSTKQLHLHPMSGSGAAFRVEGAGLMGSSGRGDYIVRFAIWLGAELDTIEAARLLDSEPQPVALIEEPSSHRLFQDPHFLDGLTLFAS